MALTRLQMSNEVLDNLGRAGAGTSVSGSTLSTLAARWINRAQTRFARKYDILFRISTATTITSQQSYALPTNLRALYSFRLEDGLSSIKLNLVMPWEFDDYYPKPNEHTTGRPSLYIPYKSTNTFELFRIPDTGYTMRIRHSIWPAELSSDGATTDYQAASIDTDDILIAYATYFAFKYLQEFTDAATWRKEGDELAEDVWMQEQKAFPDWMPVARGFNARNRVVLGEYYNDPLIMRDP